MASMIPTVSPWLIFCPTVTNGFAVGDGADGLDDALLEPDRGLGFGEEQRLPHIWHAVDAG